MKTMRFFSICFMLSAFALSAGCSKSDSGCDCVTKGENNQLLGEPVAFVDCRLNPYYGYLTSEDNNLAIIRSQQELERYITFESGSFKGIDFKKYSVLLATGRLYCGYDGDNIEKNYVRTENGEYVLSLKMHLYITTEVPFWGVAVKVPKLSADAKVRLDVVEISGNY